MTSSVSESLTMLTKEDSKGRATHAIVLFAPAIIDVVANPNLLPDYGKVSSLAEQYFNLAEFVSDLLRCVGFLGNVIPLYLLTSLTLMWADFRRSGQRREGNVINTCCASPIASWRR